MTQGTPQFSCASWNIHRGKGSDDVTDPARIAAVLAQDFQDSALDALVLQEADQDAPPHHGFLDIARVEAATGLRSVHTTAQRRWGPGSHGFLGVIVFVNTDWQVEDVTLLDLPGHCHRGAVIVDLARGDITLRLIGTHLSLSQGLRVVQMRTLGQHLFRRQQRQTVLCGDLNEWRPWGGVALSARISGLHFMGPTPATFPVRRPFLPLDRILATAPSQVVSIEVLDSEAIRMASDHRPIRAKVLLASRTKDCSPPFSSL